MTAMRAIELPEDLAGELDVPAWLQPSQRADQGGPANQGAANQSHANQSAASRAVSRWTQSAPATPGQAADPAPPASAVGPAPQRAPLRLTRRGRIVVTAVTVVLLAVLSLILARSAQATNQTPARPGQSLTKVTVSPGQSLWSVAETADPNADTRAVVQQIVELNSLSGSAVYAGQRLWVPRG